MVHTNLASLNSERKIFPWSQIFAVLSVSLPALVNGLQFTWTSPFIPVLVSKDSPVPMSFEEASYLTVIPPVATMICSPLFAKFLDSVGRKPTILFIAVPQLISWIMIAFADSLLVLYISRVMTGIADAAVFIAIPVYIGEVLEPEIRGSLGSFISVAIFFGEFLMNVIGSYASMQMTAFICGVLPVIFFATFIFMPETPYYFLMKNERESARHSLRKLRRVEDVEEELMKLTSDVQRQISESSAMKDLFVIESNRRAIFVAIGLRVANQLSGIAAFSVYTQYVFEKAGGNMSKSVSAMLFTGLQSFIVCLAPLILDKFGRRPLMIFSCFGCAVLLSIESIYFYCSEYTNIDILWFNWIPLTGMMLYIFVFSVGFGTVPTLMLSELFSASIKGKAVCFMSVFYAFCVSIISKVFQLMADNLGLFAPFCFFAVCCFLSTFFSYYCVPETKGKTLEEIQQCLKNKKIR